MMLRLPAALAATLFFASAGRACEVGLSTGWARGAGIGVMTVARNAPPCTATVWVDQRNRVKAKTLDVTVAPSNGKLTVSGAEFTYTPNRGYAGTDVFSLTGTGEAVTGQSIELAGRVSVTVK